MFSPVPSRSNRRLATAAFGQLRLHLHRRRLFLVRPQRPPRHLSAPQNLLRKNPRLPIGILQNRISLRRRIHTKNHRLRQNLPAHFCRLSSPSPLSILRIRSRIPHRWRQHRRFGFLRYPHRHLRLLRRLSNRHADLLLRPSRQYVRLHTQTQHTLLRRKLRVSRLARLAKRKRNHLLRARARFLPGANCYFNCPVSARSHFGGNDYQTTQKTSLRYRALILNL